MDNWQGQVQELQVLSAIYGHDFCIPGVNPSELSPDSEDYISRLAEVDPPLQGQEALLLVHLAAASSPLAVQASTFVSLEELWLILIFLSANFDCCCVPATCQP